MTINSFTNVGKKYMRIPAIIKNIPKNMRVNPKSFSASPIIINSTGYDSLYRRSVSQESRAD